MSTRKNDQRPEIPPVYDQGEVIIIVVSILAIALIFSLMILSPAIWELVSK